MEAPKTQLHKSQTNEIALNEQIAIAITITQNAQTVFTQNAEIAIAMAQNAEIAIAKKRRNPKQMKSSQNDSVVAFSSSFLGFTSRKLS